MNAVRVLYFANLRELKGKSEEVVETDQGLTAEELFASLFGSQIKSTGIYRVAINKNYSPLETVLKDGDEVAFIPPVSGG